MKTFKLAALALVVAFLAACSGEQSPTGPSVTTQPEQQQPQDQPGTGQPTSDPVTSIVISPAAASANPGSATQFTATLKNAAGQTLTGRTVVWSTSSSSVVDVSNNGLATAKAAGSATVTASAEGKTAAGSFSVTSAPQPPSSGWANEPSGLSTISNNPLDALNVLGWGTAWNNGTIVPASDPQRGSVLRWNYPIGFTGGKGPGMEYYDHSPAKEVFAGFWWKASDPWQNHDGSHVNKIAFWYTTSAGQNLDIQMYGTPPYRLDVVVEFPSGTVRLAPNATTSTVTLGVWHKIEWHAKYASSSSSGDGVVEWWMDGVLQGRYTNIQTPNDAGYAQYQISPTWGGLNGVKTENDYFLYDDLHLSRR